MDWIFTDMLWFIIRYVLIIVCSFLSAVPLSLFGEAYERVTGNEADTNVVGAISMVFGFVIGIALAGLARNLCT